jgi:hypothetical protein
MGAWQDEWDYVTKQTQRAAFYQTATGVTLLDEMKPSNVAWEMISNGTTPTTFEWPKEPDPETLMDYRKYPMETDEAYEARMAIKELSCLQGGHDFSGEFRDVCQVCGGRVKNRWLGANTVYPAVYPSFYSSSDPIYNYTTIYNSSSNTS